MRPHLWLFGLVIFIISLIITLNIFFQNTYQSEIAEQFNRQQLLIARTIAKNIETDVTHMESEILSIASLISERDLAGMKLTEFINYSHLEVHEEMDADIKVVDATGALRYTSHREAANDEDLALLKMSESAEPGSVKPVDRLSEGSMTFFTPIVRDKKHVGAVLVRIGVEDMNKKYLDSVRVGIRGHAWMMAGNGTLLYHPTQPGMVGKNLFQAGSGCLQCHTSFDAEKKILESGDVGFSSYIAPYGEDKLIAFSRVKVLGMPWIVCVSIPYSEVTYSIRKSMKLHSMLVISIFIVTLGGAFATVLINKKRVKAEEKAKHLETQQQLEKEIVEAKDYLENLLESTESKIMVIDREMLVRTVNSAQLRICRKGKEEIVGRNFFEVFSIASAGERETLSAALTSGFQGVSSRLSNYRYENAGETLYLNININPLVLHGAIEGIILSSSNVTEEVTLKKRLQDYALRLEDMVVRRTDELRGEKEKLDAVVSAIEGGLCLLNNDERSIVWANKLFLEWIGSSGASAIYGDEAFTTVITKAGGTGQMVQTVVSGPLAGKTGFYQITANPILDPSGKARVLVLVQDVTEIKKMEERLMQSEKLSALARISAGVAHEIGNPLTSISSYVQILREMDFDDFTRESLDTIAKHIHRITTIVRQMSSFSRTKGADLKRHDLRNLVDMTLDLVKYDKRMKNIKVNFRLPGDLPGVLVDETQLIQVLVNIILNAADAMPDGGTLDLSAVAADTEVEIRIADTGHGIAHENIERIFDPFFTTKEKGTGLGLAVSYNIIKSYHGDITVENRPEGGTMFKVKLPV